MADGSAAYSAAVLPGMPPDLSAQDYEARIKRFDRFIKTSRDHGRRVYQRYRDDRQGLPGYVTQRANIFYSNVQTLKESLFNSLPRPDVSRLHRGDIQDDAARVAATIVQRLLTYEVECAPAFREAIESAILDRLVPGIGQVWITFDVGQTPEGQPVPGSEQIRIEALYWEDFLWEPTRRWSQVSWVGRKVYLGYGELVAQYGAELADQVSYYQATRDNLTPKQINENQYCLYEIWDKPTRTVAHVFPGLPDPLRIVDDPYQLRDFFPCPRPLIANVDTTAFRPVTDYHIAQDQYTQLDNLYSRIQLIVDAVKVAGVYNAESQSIPRMLQGDENKLIPVDDWAMQAEKGGVSGQIDWYPVETVAQVLQQLSAAFEATKAILYEITGMSDIIRGASNQYETASAQQIKAQFASVRLNGYQRTVAVFVRDILRIIAELGTQLYSDQKLQAIVAPLPYGDDQFVPQAVPILRSDVLSHYKVDIQSDSLTQADWAAEKSQRMEVVQTVTQMVGQVMGAIQQSPEVAALGAQLIKFAVTGFKASSEIESFLDQQLDQLTRQSLEQQAQPPQPSPEQQKLEAEAEREQQQQQFEQQKMQGEFALKQQELQSKLAVEQQKAQVDVEKAQVELEFQRERHAMELEKLRLELAVKQLELQEKAIPEVSIEIEREEPEEHAEPDGDEYAPVPSAL